MKRIILEVTVTTPDEARRAVAAGADRLELCSGLELGGLTPSPGTFLEVRAAVAVPVYVLLRPRPGDFTYLDDDFAALKGDATWFMRNGANGIVCGVLARRGHRGRIDQVRCAELVALSNGKAVFHRAFDFLSNLPAELDELIVLGFERVLTSGGAATATDGQAMIAELVRRADGRIQVLPGGGIRPINVANLLAETGCDQVHASLRYRYGAGCQRIYDHPTLSEQMGGFSNMDAQLVREMRAVLDQ